MWLMTKHGFYSIVRRKAGEYHVRSRERLDLENLLKGVPLPGARIVDTPTADYCCRIIADEKTVLAILEFLGKTLDYPNFKALIDDTPSQQRKPYHRVGRVMADALGAFGRKGRRLA